MKDMMSWIGMLFKYKLEFIFENVELSCDFEIMYKYQNITNLILAFGKKFNLKIIIN